MRACLPGSQLSPAATRTEVDQYRAAADRLSRPADMPWTLARAASLLMPYYTADIPAALREMEAEDWAEALKGFPRWAIDNAVRWWKSADNADRRKKPLEGDIVARCRIEMARVTNTIYACDNWKPAAADAEREVPTLERRKEIAAEMAATIRSIGASMTSKPEGEV